MKPARDARFNTVTLQKQTSLGRPPTDAAFTNLAVAGGINYSMGTTVRDLSVNNLAVTDALVGNRIAGNGPAVIGRA